LFPSGKPLIPNPIELLKKVVEVVSKQVGSHHRTKVNNQSFATLTRQICVPPQASLEEKTTAPFVEVDNLDVARRSWQVAQPVVEKVGQGTVVSEEQNPPSRADLAKKLGPVKQDQALATTYYTTNQASIQVSCSSLVLWGNMGETLNHLLLP
jgi:hypothetical protein